MAETWTPKTREELLNELFQRHATLSYRGAVSVIETIESLGLRIVPVEPTEEMVKAVWDTVSPTAWEEDGKHHPESTRVELRAATAASPFAPENPNG